MERVRTKGRYLNIIQTYWMFFFIACVFAGAFFIWKEFRPMTYGALSERFIPGHHGVQLVYGASARASFEPWEPLEQNRTLKQMVVLLCAEADLKGECWTERSIRFRAFTRKHDAEKGVMLVRGVVPINIEDLTSQLLEKRMRLMGEWVSSNARDDGSFPYRYSPSNGSYPGGSNVIRELIMVQGLYAMSRVLDDETMHAAAERAEAYLFDRAYETNGVHAYMREEDGEVKLGAAALAILSLREKGGPVTERERRLGEFLLSMQRSNGSFQTFLQDEPTDENDRFYSGEALTALARLAEATGDDKYHDALSRSFPFYLSKLEEDFFPQYAPWHMQAYAIEFRSTGNEEYAEYVYFLADRLIETMLEEDREVLPDEQGRYFNPDRPDWGPPHSSSTGIYTEGLTYAYEVARARGDRYRASRYGHAIGLGTAYLLRVQWTPESAYYLRHPDRVVGALKEDIADNQLRVDQAGHAANAFARVYEIVL